MARRGPHFVTYFGSVIEALQELGGSGSPSEVIDFIGSKYEIDENELELLDSGSTRFNKNVNWARYYLVKDAYIDGSKRGVWLLTEKGRNNLAPTYEQSLDIFHRIHSQFTRKSESESSQPELEQEISIDEQEVRENEDHRKTLLTILREKVSPNGFERFTTRLLRESGFDQVEITQRSRDGGIDGKGLLKINHFVSFRVFFQCKRYTGTVGTREIRDFRGSIMGRADKGILITTGTFSRDAKIEAIRDGALPIELVDGETLLDMLEELELGVIKKRTITIYDINQEFFEEYTH